MFVLGNFLIAAAKLLDIVLFVLYWMILLRALVSWVNPDPSNPIVQFLHRGTDPILRPVRRLLPQMAIDISPIIAFLGIIFLQLFLVASLRDMGYHMRQSQGNSQQIEIQVQQPQEEQYQEAEAMFE